MSSPSPLIKCKSILLNIFSYGWYQCEIFESPKFKSLSKIFQKFQQEMLPFADKYFYPFNKLRVEYDVAFPKYKNLDAVLKIPR